MFKQKSNHIFRTIYLINREMVIYDSKPKFTKKYHKFYRLSTNSFAYSVWFFDGMSSHTFFRMSQFRRVNTQNERKQWYDYMSQLAENDLVLHHNRRSEKSLPNNYDDIYNGMHNNHKLDWKAHTKCRKQYMKNL